MSAYCLKHLSLTIITHAVNNAESKVGYKPTTPHTHCQCPHQAKQAKKIAIWWVMSDLFHHVEVDELQQSYESYSSRG